MQNNANFDYFTLCYTFLKAPRNLVFGVHFARDRILDEIDLLMLV